MDIEMTIVLAILYFAFVVWGYSKKSSGVTSVNTTPEPDCGYINYFPDEGVDDDEEESLFTFNKSSSSSTQVELEVQIEMEMETDCATVGVMVADPWEQDVVVTPIEFEFNVTQLEYQLALPPAKEVVVVVIDDKTYNPYPKGLGLPFGCAEYQVAYDYFAEMSIRQLKAECKQRRIKKYSYLKKQQLIELLAQSFVG